MKQFKESELNVIGCMLRKSAVGVRRGRGSSDCRKGVESVCVLGGGIMLAPRLK